MNPLRIIILVVLFYLLFRLLVDAGRRERKDAPGKGRRASGQPPPQDVLMEDPVCHTLIPARSAITLKKDGKIVYFCSENCRSQFTRNQGEHR